MQVLSCRACIDSNLICSYLASIYFRIKPSSELNSVIKIKFDNQILLEVSS